MDNTLMNRINELHSNNSESVSSIQLRLGDLDKESKDNITQIVNLQETINIQAERVNAVDADRQKAAEKAKADLESTVASNAKAIADLKNELGQSIVDKFRPAEDRLANIDGDIQGLNKTVAVFEQKHTEAAEKIQEVTVLTSNIQVQVKAQEQKMVEQSANDMNEIKAQLKDVDAGHQTLVQKVSGMENGVADRLDDLAKADASLLAKLSALESTNDQTVRAATADLEKKIHDAEHKLDQSSKAEIQSVCQHLEQQMQTNNSNTERRLAEADAGNQQLLEKLLEVEKDVEGKVRDNASSVQNQLTNLDADNKNNAQMLVTLQESINIQVQETKKVDAERQRSEAKAKEDLDANAAANARAIADLKDQLGETIAQRVKPTEDRLSEVNGDLKAMHGTLEQFEDAIDKRINTDVMLRIENLEKDNQKALGDLETQIGDSISQRMKPSEEKLSKVDGEISGLHKTVAVFESRHVETTKSLKEVTVLTERIQTQVNDQGQKMAEQSANDLNRINDRLQDMENQAGLSDQKIKELDAGNQNLLEKVLGMDGNLSERLDKQEQMDNTLMNRINELHSNNSESVSSIQLRLGDLDKESKDNITQIVNLQETINIQAERVNAVDADRQKAAEKAKADLESTVASNAKAIADLKNELGQSIVDKFRPAEDRLANIDGDIQGLNKTVAVFEQKHTETAEKIQEVTVLTSNIQVQVKAQEQKMVEQSANDMNEIKAQLKDVDAGHQTLVQKVSGMENGVADRLDDLAKADASLLAKLSALESTNDQTVRAATTDLEKKIHDAEHKLDQSGKAEIQSVYQHLEHQMQTNNSNKEEEHTIKNNKRTMKMHATEQKSMNSKQEKREDRLDVFPQPEPREVQVANNNEKEVVRKSPASEMRGPIAKEEEKEDKSELNENEKKGKAEEKHMDKLAANEDSEENNNNDEKRQRKEKEKEKRKEPQEFDDN